MCSVLLVAAVALLLGGTVPRHNDMQFGQSRIDDDQLFLEDLLEVIFEDPMPRAATCAGELGLETLKFFIEFNESDEDIGVQAVLGGEPYKVLKAFGPDDRKILDLKPRRGLKQQGMSDFFFESAEPSLEDFALADFLARFPAGEYEFETKTIDGIEQDGETMLTHVIPAGPVITSPQAGEAVDPDNTIITWEPVTLTTAFNPPQQPVTIVGYQVIVTREDPLRVYSVDVSAETLSVSVPPEFLDAGTEYELEILAIEQSDNQTISLIFFETE
ncbi:MAG: fibronectin type III domain-containing protein [Planctomycetota bacterium]|jgi:hypothetical protein